MRCIPNKPLAVALIAIIGIGSALGEETTLKTYTYKTLDKCKIQADVYRLPTLPSPEAGGGKGGGQPVIIWVHGGALIMGHRGQVDRALLDKLLKAGYTVVSIDYRLAPETKLPAILEDLEDA